MTDSGNTLFYSFVGKRVYDPIDSLVYPEDLELFREHLYSADGSLFPARILREDGEPVWSICQTCDKTDVGATIRFLPLEYALHRLSAQDFQLRIGSYILEAYADQFFYYDGAADSVRIISIHVTLSLDREMSFDAFRQMLLSRADHADDKARTAVESIRSGVGFFQLRLNRDLFEDSGIQRDVLIRGAAFESPEGDKSACGFIHRMRTSGLDLPPDAPQTDYLTGVLNKEEITRRAVDLIDDRKAPNTTVAIVDVDYFKNVNDDFGHQMGDEVLREVASIIEKEAGPGSITGRIGGDEFMILFTGHEDMENSRDYLRGIKNAVNMRFPAGDKNRPKVSLSIGCATFPKDADNFDDVMTLADHSLYVAKKKGRNRYVIYNAPKHGTLEDIKNTAASETEPGSREGFTISEETCILLNRAISDTGDFGVQKLLEEITVNYGVDRVVAYYGDNHRIAAIAGDTSLGMDVLESCSCYLDDPFYNDNLMEKDSAVIDNIDYFESRSKVIHDSLRRQNTFSFMHFRMKDIKGETVILSLEGVGRTIPWNIMNVRYYRLLAYAVSRYDLSGLSAH